MNNLTVIIPSKSASNLGPCIAAVRENEPHVRIVVVDDGVDIGEIINNRAWSDACADAEIVDGVKPFIFARNINIGILRAKGDVVLLNDDAILQSAGGFSLIQEEAAAHPEYGLIAATTNSVGNVNQLPQMKGLREDPRMVCFVCVLIPRRTIDLVGLLDERYIGYGMDDDDYCLRCRRAGLKIGIHDGCFVDHQRLVSTFRGKQSGNYRPNLELFKQKWGMDNHGGPA